jgi:glycosyltransferase involved in cell wall biosynthesis
MVGQGIVSVLHTRIVTGTGGGADKTVLNSSRALRDTRYRELACYFHPPGDPGFSVIAERARELECPLFGIADRGPFDIRSLAAVARLCRDEKIGIWHGHDYKTNLFGLLLRPFLKFRLVTTVHGWGVQQTRRTQLYYAIDRWCLPRYDQVIAVSSDLYTSCLEAGVAVERLQLIENGIDADGFRRLRPSHVARGVASASGPLVIGAVGRLSDEKGFDLLIEAVAALVDEGHDIELWIAGDGECRASLIEKANRTGHADRIRLLGFVADTRSLFEKFDIFCLSSLREGLPNVVLEAMSMEVPVLATRCGGIEALQIGDRAASLVPVGSVEVLRDGLRDLIKDGDRRGRMAAYGRQIVEERFGFRTRMGRVVEVYERLWA